VLPTDAVLLSLPTIVGLTEEVRDHAENSGRVRLFAQPALRPSPCGEIITTAWLRCGSGLTRRPQNEAATFCGEAEGDAYIRVECS
jgi:hypothetical protein